MTARLEIADVCGESYLLDVFLATKEAENCEAVTIRNYRDSVRRLLGAAGVEPHELKADHLVAWLAGMAREGLSPGTRAYHQRHAWVFLGWLVERGDLERDPRKGLKRVKVPEVRHRSLELETFQRLLAVAGDRPRRATGRPARVEHRLRGLAMLHLLWSTGIRRNELVNVALEDLDLVEAEGSGARRLTFRRREVLIRFAKGKKTRVVPFDAAAAAALIEYIHGERALGAGGRPRPGPLFLERGGEGLTISAAACWLKRLSARAGVAVSMHDFRRGFAARVRREGLDVGHTATLLGHETLTMTIHYSKAGKEEAAIAAYRRTIG